MAIRDINVKVSPDSYNPAKYNTSTQKNIGRTPENMASSFAARYPLKKVDYFGNVDRVKNNSEVEPLLVSARTHDLYKDYLYRLEHYLSD